MIKAVVKFWGTNTDQFGMPEPFHSYLIVSSLWEEIGAAVASIVPLSTVPPMQRLHFPVLQGGEKAAYDEALKAISTESFNVGLSRHIIEE